MNVDVAGAHGDYPELFAGLLRTGGLDADLVTYDLQEDGAPTDLGGHDGWIISGSISSAYDDEPWIRDLEDLCRTLLDRDEPVVGICFGHQVLAQALGWRVAKADPGWGVGVHHDSLTRPVPTRRGTSPHSATPVPPRPETTPGPTGAFCRAEGERSGHLAPPTSGTCSELTLSA